MQKGFIRLSIFSGVTHLIRPDNKHCSVSKLQWLFDSQELRWMFAYVSCLAEANSSVLRVYSMLCTVACRRGGEVHSWQCHTLTEKDGVGSRTSCTLFLYSVMLWRIFRSLRQLWLFIWEWLQVRDAYCCIHEPHFHWDLCTCAQIVFSNYSRG